MPPANALMHRAIAFLAAISTVVAVCLGIIVARSRNASRLAASQMRVAFSDQKTVLDEANKREQRRHANLTRDLVKISRDERAAGTPVEIAKRLQAAFPPLPHPLSISLAPPAPDSPDVPTVVNVPQEDLKPLFDRLEECRACQERLAAAQQDLLDERAKLSALTIERDAAVKASRGGGFWARFRTGAKWFAIGGAMGAIAASAAHR